MHEYVGSNIYGKKEIDLVFEHDGGSWSRLYCTTSKYVILSLERWKPWKPNIMLPRKLE
mgnify:CR=1